MSNKEEWRPIKGYEGIYEVSSHGRVRSLDRRDSGGRPRKGKILSPAIDRVYPFVGLKYGDNYRVVKVHTLVAEAFLGECPEGHEVAHRDHDGSNNHVDNLEYVTHLENVQQSARAGRMGKLSPEDVKYIRATVERDPKTPIGILAEAYGVTTACIHNVIKARRYKLIPNADGSEPVPLETERRILTEEDILSMQAQGYTLPEIGRHYGVEYSTPYQILRRAALRRAAQAS